MQQAVKLPWKWHWVEQSGPRQMLCGCYRSCRSGGGSKGKPVGLVYMACAVKGKAEVLEYHFKGNRGKIREQSMMKALDPGALCVKA